MVRSDRLRDARSCSQALYRAQVQPQSGGVRAGVCACFARYSLPATYKGIHNGNV
jgi:hypothetical protein